MRIVEADTKQTQKEFLGFRKRIYKASVYVDNNYILAQEVFGGKLHFMKDMDIFPIMVVENDRQHTERVLCEAMVVYTKELPDYVQLCFFESEPGAEETVKCLLDYAMEKGRERNAKRLVAGLYGHVNYGLGFQSSHFDCKNSFSAGCNPEYYLEYFRRLGFEEIGLNSYVIEKIDERLDRYSALIRKLERNYEFKYFDKKDYDYWLKLYTDLNNECFVDHRYYYQRQYIDDKEMLDELFLFMKEDSLIFAFQDGEPAGFIMWYPDYNELAKAGEAFGAKHFVKNVFKNKQIQTAKIMEFGIREEYKKAGLPLGLIVKVREAMKNYGCTRVESSWVLAENGDSNSVCAAVCDGIYKTYSTFEKDI